MVFTDWKFFVFFLIAFSVYWSIPSNFWRKIWLLACSVVFYAAWDWRFLGLVVLVIVNTYAVTLAVDRSSQTARRKAILTAGIVVSLSVLGFFKYYNFFVDSLGQIAPVDLALRGLVLPIGISFYTFHSLSYMIDTYRQKIVPTRNFTDVALYILFFPQLVAGPIVRATDLLPQMRTARRFAAADFKLFLALFLIGYFKKAVVSDNISPLVDAFFASPSEYGAGDVAEAVILYATQIYCDFSGYTDMAIAAAGMLGYQLKPNFNHPYLAPNLVDFWRRWHMSLSSWLRDYLYIPLGGNRGGALFTARNILITMLLGGLWHGASWNFVAWGGLHGVGLIGCRAWRAMRERYRPGYKPHYSVTANVATFLFVCFAWIFFRSPNFTNAAAVIDSFGVLAPPTLLAWQYALPLGVALLAVHVFFYRIKLSPEAFANITDPVFAGAFGAAIAVILPFVNVAVKPFIYFQF
jgi:alginate O-acetyltransferase complex protein AlgI